jgi:solute:Na+ symporter, SSS family
MTLTWLVVYMVGMFIVTLVFSRRRQTFEEFVLARRSVNFLPLLFSTWAANFGGGALIGWTGGFYQHGLDWWWLPVGFLLALVVANRFLVAKVRDLEQFTLPDLIGVRYGDRPRHLSAVVVIIVGVLAMSFQILALAGIVSTVAGISLSSAMVVSAVVFVLATVIGGLSSVVLTDLLQSAIMLLGLLLAVMFLIWQTGGLYELWTKLPETHRQFGALTRSGQGLGDGFAVFGAIATSQVLFQKVLAASSIAVAKRMVHWLIPSFLLTYLALWVFGLSALLLLGRNIGAETVLPQLIKVQFPPVLGGILMAAMLGVIITTANAILLGVASNITRDVYQPFLRRWGGQDRSVGVVRVAIVCVALFALWRITIECTQ